MSCRVERNSKGKPIVVLLENLTEGGKTSVLFKNIVENPLVEEQDALEVYQNIYSKKFKKKFGEWEIDITGKVKVYRAGDLKRVDGKFGNAIYFAENFKHSLQFGSPETYYVDKDQVLAFDSQLDYLDEVATFNEIETVPNTEQKNAYLDAKFAEGKIIAVGLSKDRVEYLVPSSDFLDNGINHSIMYTNGEPKMFYLTPTGEITDNYEDALNNTPEGKIRMGVITTDDILNLDSDRLFEGANNDFVTFNGKYRLNNTQAFLDLMSIDSNSNPNTQDGFINYGIRNKKVAANKKLVGDTYFMKGYGETDSLSEFNGRIVEADAAIYFGVNSVKSYEDGTFELNPEDDTVIRLVGEDGEVTLSKEELKKQLKEGRFSELNSRYDGFADTVYTLFREDNDLYQTSEENIESTKEEKDLRIILLTTLNKIGVKTTSISNYISDYNTRQSVDPSVEALSDITNSVVAFAEGQETIDNLSEETAHFIVESFSDQDLIEGLLPQVEATDEWKQHNGRYYNKYSENFEGLELDKIVRKEVLGKILKNKIQDNFNTQGVNEQESSLINSLKDAWTKFKNLVRSLYSTNYREDVDFVLDEIANKVVNEEISEYLDEDLLKESDFTMFKLSDKKALLSISKARQLLERKLNVLKKTKDVSHVEVQRQIKDLGLAIENTNEWHGVKVIIAAVDPQIKKIKRQLEDYKKKSEKDDGKTAYFNQEEQQAFRSLTEEFLPLLVELRAVIENELEPVEGVSMERTLEQMDNLIKEINNLKGEVALQSGKDFDAIFNRLISMYVLPEGERERIEKSIERDLAETSWLQSMYGSLEHASNPLLGMLGKLININNQKANTAILRDINPFLARVEKGGWNLSKMEELLTKKDGKITGYTQSPYDWSEYKSAEMQAQVDAFNEVFGQSLTIKEYNRALETNKIPKKSDYTQEELFKYNGLMAKWYDENTEKRYKKEFYDKKEQLYKELGLSDDTLEFLMNISTQRYDILSKYYTPNGKLDYFEVDARDRGELAILAQQRKAAKSIVDSETGERKTGTKLKLAVDLQLLDGIFRLKKSKTKKEDLAEFNKDNSTSITMGQIESNDLVVSDDFFNTLAKVEATKGREAAFNWLMVNGGIVFNDSFWKGLKEGSTSLVQKLENIKDSVRNESIEDSEKLEEISDKLKDLLERKTEILKQYQVPNNPSEIDQDKMAGNVLMTLRNIETELQTLFSDVNSILRRYDEAEVTDPVIQTENTVNEAYSKSLKDSGLGELDFILKHVTERDSNGIKEVVRRIKKIQQGESFVDKVTQRFLEGYFQQEDMSVSEMRTALEGEDAEVLAVAFGKSRVLPYFKRFAPKGYDALLQSLKTGETSVMDFVDNIKEGKNKEGILGLLGVSTQFSWTEDEAGSTLVNKNYDENFEGGRRQPKMDKYLDDSFFKEYGANKTDYINNKTLVASSNLDKFTMLEELWDIKRKGLEAYNESDSQSIYLIPQASKGTSQKFKDFVSATPGGTISNSIKDIIYNRVDDLGYGDRINGEDVANIADMRLIPKYYIRPLEETSDISTELAYSYSLFLQSAYVYKERLNTVSDAMVIEQKLLDSRFTGGKHAETTRAFEMYKNFMDSYFFGIKRSRKFMVTLKSGKQLDVSKIAIGFDKFVRAMNIGFSVPVAATGAVTGIVFFGIESYIGEHMNKNSTSWATKELAKITPGFLTDIGKINQNNKLHQFGEKFRVYNMIEKTQSSGFNRIIRSMNNLPYKFSAMANFPIAPRIMLTVLDDFRLIDGKFVEFNIFKQQSEFDGKSKKEIVAQWNTHRENSMYNLMEAKDGVMEFKDNVVEQVGEEYLEGQLSRVQNKITSVNANVDSIVPQEDKSAATRDFVLNYTTAHRGWLSIAIQRKTKKSHFNFATGQREEGHYRSLATYLRKSLSLMEEKNMKAFVKAFKENWHGLEDYEKRNLKRIMVELGAFISLLSLGIIVAAIADDDDNKDLWALQFSAYIYFRTINEVGSVQAPTGVFGLVDTIQAPFIAINSLKEIMDVKGWSIDEVNAGAYKGHSKLYKRLAKLTWGKHLYELKGIKKKSEFYRLMNSETLFLL